MSRAHAPGDPRIDPHPAADYPEGLYRPTRAADSVASFADVDDAALAGFRERGYLVIREAFDPAEVDATLAALGELIDRDPPFEQLQFESWAADRLGELSADRKQDAVRKLMHFTDAHPALGALAAHPGLMGVVRRIVNGEPALFQSMALLKPPGGGREKPWHQDHAYFNLPLDAPVVGVWIALDEATEANGCMHVLEGAHRDGPVVHFRRRDWQICDDQMVGRPCVSVPLAPGGCLLFHSLLPHGTPVNRTDQRRRAVQFHYAAPDAPAIATDARLAVFGAEGKDVTC